MGVVGGKAKFCLVCSGVLRGRNRGDDVLCASAATLSFKFGVKYAQLMQIDHRKNR